MIRPYQDSDLDLLLDVWYVASTLAHPFLTEAFQTQERENIRNIYIPNTKTWVYLNAHDLVGFISMIDNEIGAIFIRPDHHGQGIGTKLINYIAPFYDSLEVEVFKENKIGRPFYKKYGFVFLKEYLHEATNSQVLRLKFTK